MFYHIVYKVMYLMFYHITFKTAKIGIAIFSKVVWKIHRFEKSWRTKPSALNRKTESPLPKPISVICERSL